MNEAEASPAVQPAAVRFTEEMKGWVAFGETDHARGLAHGRAQDTALMFHLTIEVQDIARFLADPRREATPNGWVRCEALGGVLPITGGAFNLMVDSDHAGERRMLYRLFFADRVGHPLTLSGYKVISRRAGLHLWPDTSTLHTRILAGHLSADDEPRAEVVASGVLRIHKLDFARQLCSFRSTAASRVEGMRALAKFTRLFVAELWPTYRYELVGAAALAPAVALGVGVGSRRAWQFGRAAGRRLALRGKGDVDLSAFRMRWRTRLLVATSATAGVILIGAEAVRVWRLGALPLQRGEVMSKGVRAVPASLRVLREGYRVSSTRENTIFNVLSSFMVTLGITRTITGLIRKRGSLGPIRDLSAGGRHIHHFIPGMIVSLISGGVALNRGRDPIDRWLAIPYGIGAALILDEAALLLELQDVYWSQEGVLSVQAAFATMALLAAIAYAEQIRRRGAPGVEADWQSAALAWDSLSELGRVAREWEPSTAVPDGRSNPPR